MDLIDEEGNLFGRINIVDALIVLVLVATIVSGAALVTGQGGLFGGEQTVRHATLALGSQPTYVAGAVDPGDTITRPGSPNLTVTDVFATPRDDGAYMTVRVRIPGQRVEDTVRYDGAPLRLGRSLSLTTDAYNISGQIIAVGERESLATTTRHVTLTLGSQPSYVAGTIDPGDTVSRPGVPNLTVTDVFATPRRDGTHVTVRVRLTGQRVGDRLRYDGAPLQLGRSLLLTTDAYDVSGQVIAIGDGESLATTTRTVQIATNMSSPMARSIRSGDPVRIAGRDLGHIETVSTRPTMDPNLVRTRLTARITVHRRTDQVTFGGRPVRAGEPITLTTDRHTIRASIAAVSRR